MNLITIGAHQCDLKDTCTYQIFRIFSLPKGDVFYVFYGVYHACGKKTVLVVFEALLLVSS